MCLVKSAPHNPKHFRSYAEVNVRLPRTLKSGAATVINVFILIAIAVFLIGFCVILIWLHRKSKRAALKVATL